MNRADWIALLPWLLTAATPVALLALTAIRRNHCAAALLAAAGLVLALAALPVSAGLPPRQITPLVVADGYARLCTAFLLAAALAVIGLSYGYFRRYRENREEFYILLLLATLGGSILAASNHFASFFLGLEILSVSQYALVAYPRSRLLSIEAGVKYIVLAGASSAFLAFGAALIYAAGGALDFPGVAARALEASAATNAAGIRLLTIAGAALLLVGVGFKLAVVPFHLWTPDVYQGAPVPVTAFVATVSKGAVAALFLRLLASLDPERSGPWILFVTLIALASMIAGNLLALLQKSVKRILAYSSIAHMGYLLVAFLASGPEAPTAVTFYLAAYFATTVGAFGVLTVLSTPDRDADSLLDLQGLAWRRPILAGLLAVMLFSLAGIPLTAGFVGKFLLASVAVESRLWLPVLVLAGTSGIGIFYYLRILLVLFEGQAPAGLAATADQTPPVSAVARIVLLALCLIVFWLGAAPSSLLRLIQAATQSFP
jgi:NADH-quinone oxidoreductase subunit N